MREGGRHLKRRPVGVLRGGFGGWWEAMQALEALEGCWEARLTGRTPGGLSPRLERPVYGQRRSSQFKV